MKVFIDTNLVLDVLAKRKPFYEKSSRIWEMTEKGELQGYLSATSVTDIFYILKKQLGTERPYGILDQLLMVFEVVAVSKVDIRKALKLGLKDFEDALQLICAKKIKASFLITRNKKDFREAKGIEIIDPDAFLIRWERSG